MTTSTRYWICMLLVYVAVGATLVMANVVTGGVSGWTWVMAGAWLLNIGLAFYGWREARRRERDERLERDELRKRDEEFLRDIDYYRREP